MSLDQTKEDRRQRARAERRRGGSEVRGERIEVRKPRSPSRPLSLSRFLDVLFALQTSYLSPPLASGPLYQGWVHAPGRRTGLQLLVLLSEGTVDGERRTSLPLFPLLPDPRHHTLDPFSSRPLSSSRVFALPTSDLSPSHLRSLPRTGPCSWTKYEGRIFSFS